MSHSFVSQSHYQSDSLANNSFQVKTPTSPAPLTSKQGRFWGKFTHGIMSELTQNQGIPGYCTQPPSFNRAYVAWASCTNKRVRFKTYSILNTTVSLRAVWYSILFRFPVCCMPLWCNLARCSKLWQTFSNAKNMFPKKKKGYYHIRLQQQRKAGLTGLNYILRYLKSLRACSPGNTCNIRT